MYDTIIVVDANPTILTALKICLAGAFKNVVRLSQPDDLIATIRSEHPDLVLLDMNFSLGVNSGQDGLLWLRAVTKLHPEVPVVLMTAYGDIELAVKGMKNGAADFVTKPWDNEELVGKLKEVIEKSRSVVPLDKMEADHIRRVIEQCNGNISKAAKLLGVTRQTLYAKLKRP